MINTSNTVYKGSTRTLLVQLGCLPFNSISSKGSRTRLHHGNIIVIIRGYTNEIANFSWDRTLITSYVCSSLVVLLNFTQPFYEVTESEGMGGVCVRLELPQGGAIRLPVSFRTHIRQLSDRRTCQVPAMV